jgi:hypothetical protein
LLRPASRFGFVSAIINAVIGALLLLLVIRLVRGGADCAEVGEGIGEDVVADDRQGAAFAGFLESRPLGGGHGNVELSSALRTGSHVGVA